MALSIQSCCAAIPTIISRTSSSSQTNLTHPPAPAPHDLLSVYGSESSRDLFWVKLYSICPVFRFSHCFFQVHPHCSRCQNVLPFQGWIIFHCVNKPHCLYIIHGWALVVSTSCQSCCCEQACANLFESLLSVPRGLHPGGELLTSWNYIHLSVPESPLDGHCSTEYWQSMPGVLWFMGSQRVGHNWVTELNPYIVLVSCPVLSIVILPLYVLQT